MSNSNIAHLDRRSLLISSLTAAVAVPLASTAMAQTAKSAASEPSINDWMSWQGGVDLVGLTDANLKQPNIIIHLARMVHTPMGSAPSGMVFFQPDPSKPPLIMGFVSGNPLVGAYFGPHIFKGTPFETAPVLKAKITIDETKAPNAVSSKISVGKHVFELTLSGLSPLGQVNRPVGALPFTQQGLEAPATTATLKHNGQPITVIIPPMGMSGGAAAVWSPTGLYAR